MRGPALQSGGGGGTDWTSAWLLTRVLLVPCCPERPAPGHCSGSSCGRGQAEPPAWQAAYRQQRQQRPRQRGQLGQWLWLCLWQRRGGAVRQPGRRRQQRRLHRRQQQRRQWQHHTHTHRGRSLDSPKPRLEAGMLSSQDLVGVRSAPLAWPGIPFVKTSWWERPQSEPIGRAVAGMWEEAGMVRTQASGRGPPSLNPRPLPPLQVSIWSRK